MLVPSHEYGFKFRYKSEEVDDHQHYVHMLSISKALLEHYNIPLGIEPCLIFVNPRSPDQFSVIRLDKSKVMEDLLDNVLIDVNNNIKAIKNFRSISLAIFSIDNCTSVINLNNEIINGLSIEIEDILKINIERNTLLKLKRSYYSSLKQSIKIGDLSKTGDIFAFCQERDLHISEDNIKIGLDTVHMNNIIESGQNLKKFRRKRSRNLDSIYNSSTLRSIIDIINLEIVSITEIIRQPVIEQRKRIDRSKIDISNCEQVLKRNYSFNISKFRKERENLKIVLQKKGFSIEELEKGDYELFFAIKNFEKQRDAMNNQQEKASRELKILILSANPQATARLDLEEELRSIEGVFKSTAFRDNLRLIISHATRPEDLIEILRNFTPDIVHFAGHGDAEGLVMRGEGGKLIKVSETALSQVFQNRNISLVILNSCFSSSQAESIIKSVPSVVGTISAVTDAAARIFSLAFYRSIGDGCSIEEAFRDATDLVALYNQKDVFKQLGDGTHKFFSST